MTISMKTNQDGSLYFKEEWSTVQIENISINMHGDDILFHEWDILESMTKCGCAISIDDQRALAIKMISLWEKFLDLRDKEQ